MMKAPAVSVIMLTYNREALVPRAIESILAQTLSDFEFIIVNNGSSDGSGAVADRYAASDPRISVLHLTRGNIGSGRNAGLAAATGDYIAFIDDDDWCEPDFLEFLHRLAVDNKADVAICGAADKICDEQLLLTPEQAVVELMWRRRYNMAFPTKLFTHALSQQLHFPERDKYDDISQMHRLLALATCVAYHGLPKYTFYRHDTNNSAWTTAHELLDADTLDEYLGAYRSRTVWLGERFPDNAATWHYFEWSFMLSMVDKIARLGLRDCEPQRVAMVAELREHYSEFYSCSLLQDFEKEWMDIYL